MRHRVKSRKLKRTASHRAALLRSLSIALILHKRIRTTLAKAKELRGFIEPLITKARVGDLHRQRLVMDILKDKPAGKELFTNIVPAIGDRPGGYTRVVKLGNRLGDGASVAMIELVNYNEFSNQRAAEKTQSKEEKAKQKKENKKKEAAELPSEK